MSAPVPVPPGYSETRLIDPFEIHVGPVFERDGGGARRFAFRVDDRHINLGGVAHGAMLLTFADCTLGLAVWDATGNAPSATLNMQSHFLKSARKGDLVEVVPEITRTTRSLVFARGDFMVNGDIVMAAASLWKLIGR